LPLKIPFVCLETRPRGKRLTGTLGKSRLEEKNEKERPAIRCGKSEFTKIKDEEKHWAVTEKGDTAGVAREDE